MSKSYGNYIGIDEPANEMFGKVMSISDELMWKYYELLTDLGPSEISNLRSQIENGENPATSRSNSPSSSSQISTPGPMRISPKRISTADSFNGRSLTR